MNPAPTIANRTGLPASARARRAVSRMIIPSPDLPGGGAPPPVLLQHLLVAQGIHRLPEPAVAGRGELAVTSQPAQRVPLPDRLGVVDILDRRPLRPASGGNGRLVPGKPGPRSRRSGPPAGPPSRWPGALRDDGTRSAR